MNTYSGISLTMISLNVQTDDASWRPYWVLAQSLENTKYQFHVKQPKYLVLFKSNLLQLAQATGVVMAWSTVHRHFGPCFVLCHAPPLYTFGVNCWY
jgi:hypothetical protein